MRTLRHAGPGFARRRFGGHRVARAWADDAMEVAIVCAFLHRHLIFHEAVGFYCHCWMTGMLSRQLARRRRPSPRLSWHHECDDVSIPANDITMHPYLVLFRLATVEATQAASLGRTKNSKPR